VCLAVSVCACGPALTILRLSPPKAALGTAHTVFVRVTPGTNDVMPDEAEKVSELVRRRFSERLTEVGYAVCPQLPCGEGVLELVIEEASFAGAMPHLPDFAMMEAAVKAVRGGGNSGNSTTTTTILVPVNVQLRLGVTLVEPDGRIGYRGTLTRMTSRTSTIKEVVNDAVESMARGFGDEFARQSPFVKVPLEGGGPLNRGVELLHKAEWANAVTYFTELTRAQPELDGAWYDLGFALEAQNEWAAALGAYREASKRAKKPHYEKAVSAAQGLVSGPQTTSLK